MRIIGGRARGRTLVGPKDEQRVRPTSDRVRQTLFDCIGQQCGGLNVVDFYSGTGALGLEAASRDAASVVFVDAAADSINLAKENAARLKLPTPLRFIQADALLAVDTLTSEGLRFELAVADPPYRYEHLGAFLTRCATKNLLVPGGWLVMEHSKRVVLPVEVGDLRQFDVRRFGDTMLTLFARADGTTASEPS